jgi:Membrane bound O-acyl transferase family
MHGTTIKPAWRFDWTAASALAPLIVLPTVACTLIAFVPNWQAMWLLAVSIYFGLKWLTFVSSPLARRSSMARTLGYLLLWPGMNARAFLDARSHAARPSLREWLLAITNLSAGLVLLFVIVPRLNGEHAIARGWIGMIGLTLVLHFGFLHVMSLGWRFRGVDAEPLMDFPIKASSLSDFWGRRWNRAFRDVAYAQIFRPLVGRVGVAWATIAVFIVSGLIHDLVISVPVRGGWGGPTLYFVLQGVGLLAERSRLGLRLGFGRGLTGRIVCVLFVVAPVGLLFHEPFVRRAILPTLAALGITMKEKVTL